MAKKETLSFINAAPILSSTPKAEDYEHIPFRLISSGVVGRSWQTTDFPADVLKESIPLLEGVSAATNHWFYSVGDVIGVVNNCQWEESFVDSNGNTIPAGIIGDYVIDNQMHADLLRNLKGVPEEGIPPAVKGSSVSVVFDYVPSHEFQYDWQFEEALGTIVNGELVRRIVTKIHEYRESSLVLRPADKNATSRVGKDTKAKMMGASRFSSMRFSELPEDVKQTYHTTGEFEILQGFDEIAEEEQKDAEPVPTQTPQPEPQNFELQLNTLRQERIQSEARYQQEISLLQTSQANLQSQVADYAAQVGSLTQKLNLAEAKNKELEPRAIIGDTHLIELRRETAKFYQLAVGNTDPFMLKQIEEVGYDTLKAFHKQYSELAEGKYTLACQKCGEIALSRQSSIDEAVEIQNVETDNLTNRFFSANR